MSSWTYKEFTNSSAANVERDMLSFLNTNPDFLKYPPLLLKLSITDAANEDAYGVIVYFSNPPQQVPLPPINGADKWTTTDLATAQDAVNNLNSLDSGEAILSQLTVRKLRSMLTFTVFTPQGA